MLFNSYAFILGFLPVALLLFHILRFLSFRLALGSLILASVIFYSYWNPIYTPLLLGSVVVNYILGNRIAGSRSGKWLLALGIVFNLSLIGWFKYSKFLCTLLLPAQAIPAIVDDIVLPLAISFFTFQQVAYLVDIRRGIIQPKGFLDYLFFVTFFPQLIAGPIVRYQEIEHQVERLTFKRKVFVSSFTIGLFFFSIGLFKKVVCADQLAYYANSVFNLVAERGSIGVRDAWIGTFSYSLQLYFDFSGYSDMAIGLGSMFGFVLPINFFSPYKATSIVDFWRRWHMTLSSFFRDYLYIPLGGNRNGPLLQCVNLLIVMGLVGLWHGAGMTFVAWGLFHGILLLGNHLWSKLPSIPLPGATAVTTVCGRVFTLAAVMWGWVLFRSESFGTAMAIYRSLLFQETIYTQAVSDAGLYQVATVLIVVLGSVALFLPNTTQVVGSMRHFACSVRRLQGTGSRWLVGRRRARLTLANAALVGWMLYFAMTGLRSGSTDFLYFNF